MRRLYPLSDHSGQFLRLSGSTRSRLPSPCGDVRPPPTVPRSFSPHVPAKAKTHPPCGFCVLPPSRPPAFTPTDPLEARARSTLRLPDSLRLRREVFRLPVSIWRESTLGGKSWQGVSGEISVESCAQMCKSEAAVGWYFSRSCDTVVTTSIGFARLLCLSRGEMKAVARIKMRAWISRSGARRPGIAHGEEPAAGRRTWRRIRAYPRDRFPNHLRPHGRARGGIREKGSVHPA